MWRYRIVIRYFGVIGICSVRWLFLGFIELSINIKFIIFKDGLDDV